ncbi:MAG: hypothetical protein H0V88_01740 [Pyrinomonadaceae bacterium]|nr:hypothetical protein [Pyrinomonadaceae bacterium]
MKSKLLIALLVIAITLFLGVAAVVVLNPFRGSETSEAQPTEIHETFELSPGATVEVRGINGPVLIETADTNTAEVHITRSARDAESLARNRVVLEHTPTSILVRTENARGSFWKQLWGGWWRGGAKQEVTMRLPRRIDLRVRGTNGKVTVGATEGTLSLDGINGRVEVSAMSTSDAEVSGVNGSVNLGISQLGGRGARINGVNGAINLNIAAGVNADLSVRGINGRVESDLPNVSIEHGEDRSNYSTRIGAGGTPLSLSGINGRVHLSPLTTTN